MIADSNVVIEVGTNSFVNYVAWNKELRNNYATISNTIKGQAKSKQSKQTVSMLKPLPFSSSDH